MRHYTPDLLNRTILEPLVEPAADVAFALDNIDCTSPSVTIADGGEILFRRFSGFNPRFNTSIATDDSVAFVRSHDGLTITGQVGTFVGQRQFLLSVTGMTVQYAFETTENFNGFFAFDFTIPAGTTLTSVGYGVDLNETTDAAVLQAVVDATAAANVGNTDYNAAQNTLATARIILRNNSTIRNTDRFRLYTGVITQSQIPRVSENRLVLADISGTENLVHLLGDITTSVFDPGAFSTTVKLPDIVRPDAITGTPRIISGTQGWYNLFNYVGDLRLYVGQELREGVNAGTGSPGDFVTTIDRVLIEDNLGRWSSAINTFYVEGNSHNWRIIFPNNLDPGQTGFFNLGSEIILIGPIVEHNILGQII